MKRLVDEYGTLTEDGNKVMQDTKYVFKQIEEYIDNNLNNYPMKELEELLYINIQIACTIARQKAKRDYLIAKHKEETNE